MADGFDINYYSKILTIMKQRTEGKLIGMRTYVRTVIYSSQYSAIFEFHIFIWRFFY